MTEEKNTRYGKSCGDCSLRSCDGKGGMYPDFCLTEGPQALSEDLINEAVMTYLNDPDDLAFAQISAFVEAEKYGKVTRLEEIARFAEKMGYERLGIATCVGLLYEARQAVKYFRHKGFDVFCVSCKAGAIPKEKLSMDPVCQETGPNICNPILQAKALNEKKSQFNIVMGLCVGHDSLFYKYSEAPVTTLVTKDRVLGHNPAAVLYQLGSYYSKLMK